MDAIVILTLLGLGYMAPVIVAMHRGHPHLLAIGALTILGGWTILGWFVALAWAVGPWRPGVSDHPSEEASAFRGLHVAVRGWLLGPPRIVPGAPCRPARSPRGRLAIG